MSAKFCYSLNGENYAGDFESREFALATALDKARKLPDPPGTVFVAQKVLADPHAAGHAKWIVQRMADQSDAEEGGAGSRYLKSVKPALIAELDKALEERILLWLTRHRLMPTRCDIEAISEHAVPQPEYAGWGRSENNEVHDLGVSDSAFDG